jgi:hypothetical protein
MQQMHVNQIMYWVIPRQVKIPMNLSSNAAEVIINKILK